MVTIPTISMTLGDFCVALREGRVLDIKPIGTSTSNGSYIFALVRGEDDAPPTWQPYLLSDAK
jgi:hypothetical protein